MKLVSEDLFGPLFELILDAVLVVDDDLRFVGANSAACELVGYSRQEISELTLADVTPPEDVSALPEIWSKFIAAGALSGQYRLRRHDGRVRITEFRAVANAMPGLHISTLRDVTAAVEASEALRQQHELLQTIVDHIPVMLNFFDRAGRLQWVNSAWEQVLGWTLQEAQQIDIVAAAYPDPLQRARVRGLIQRAAAIWSDFETRRRDGVVIDTSWAEVRLSDGTTIGIGQDITHRKRVERELVASREQLRRLSARFSETVERERKTVAQELHDELGQALTALKMDLNWVLEQMRPDEPLEMRQRVAQMSSVMDNAIADVRRISAGLRPAALDRLGLLDAIAGLARGVEQRSGVRCRLKTSLTAVDLERGVASQVYRIVQEALTNCLRHSRATRITVTVEKHRDRFEIGVRDNGTGISDRAIANPDALGLLGMKERALLIGAALDIRRLPRRGTVVRLAVPQSAAP